MKHYIIDIFCAGCRTFLYKYEKDKKGHLVKCYEDMILKDGTKGDLKCPNCGQGFARETTVHNRPANKIIQGKVIYKGHC